MGGSGGGGDGYTQDFVLLCGKKENQSLCHKDGTADAKSHGNMESLVRKAQRK